MADSSGMACTKRELADATRVAAALRDTYLQVRVLPDGSVAALGRLLFTTAIYLGCHEAGWARRFCFSDGRVAEERFTALRCEDDEPPGYVARRG